MRKLLILALFISGLLTLDNTFWASAVDQVKNLDTSQKVFWLVSPDTVVNIILKLIYVILAFIWTFMARKIAQNKLIWYLEWKLEWKWWWDEVMAVVSRSVNVTILIIWASVILWIVWVDLGIFMWWIWLGLWFTLKTFLVNFISWVIMVVQWTYHIWDLVKVWDETWRIVKINSLFTVIEKLDWLIFYVPNVRFLEDVVSNYNSNDKRRVDVNVSVDYDTDLVKAKNVAMKVIDNFPQILKDPWAKVLVEELWDSSINLSLRFWIKVKDWNYLETKSNVTETVNLAFKQVWIKIPFPQIVISNRESK